MSFNILIDTAWSLLKRSPLRDYLNHTSPLECLQEISLVLPKVLGGPGLCWPLHPKASSPWPYTRAMHTPSRKPGAALHQHGFYKFLLKYLSWQMDCDPEVETKQILFYCHLLLVMVFVPATEKKPEHVFLFQCFTLYGHIFPMLPTISQSVKLCYSWFGKIVHGSCSFSPWIASP